MNFVFKKKKRGSRMQFIDHIPVALVFGSVGKLPKYIHESVDLMVLMASCLQICSGFGDGRFRSRLLSTP